MTAVAPARPQRFRRPYARIRGTEPSVTTILGAMLDKPGLSWAAARVTALFAVYHDDWRSLPPDEAVDVLRRHHRGVWDSRAAMGTVVHAFNEAWCDGLTVDIEQTVYDMAAKEREAKSWFGREDEAIDTCLGYVDGLEAFWHAFTPETVLVEAVVRSPGLYIGQTDWVAEIAGELWLLDLKTTAEQDAEKAIYTDSWTLQTAAYRGASEVVLYEADEKGRPRECGTAPWPAIERTGIVHLRGDGTFTLYETQADEEAHARFCDLARTYAWLKKLEPCKPVEEEQ